MIALLVQIKQFTTVLLDSIENTQGNTSQDAILRARPLNDFQGTHNENEC